MAEEQNPSDPEQIDLDSTRIRFQRAARPAIRTLIILAVVAVAIYAIGLTVVLVRVEQSNSVVAKAIDQSNKAIDQATTTLAKAIDGHEKAERDRYFELSQKVLLVGTKSIGPLSEEKK